MTPRNPVAGGFLLMMCIVAGLFWGIWNGRPFIGALAGTAVGIVTALIVWLLDRRRA